MLAIKESILFACSPDKFVVLRKSDFGDRNAHTA